MRFLLVQILSLAVVPTIAQSAPMIKVRLDFVEALAPKDTTSSVRYQNSYEMTIDAAKAILQKKLAGCGYEIESQTQFYEATDALKAKEFAEVADAAGSWLIIGPRRSNHYLLLVQGAKNLPTVSIMASADSIQELGGMHVSLSPYNSEMARVAAKKAKAKSGKSATYVSVVNSDCANCMDFAKAFNKAAASMKIKKLNEILITGEVQKADEIRQAVEKFQPSFVLLPNYSKVSSLIMAAFNESAKIPFFVGGDGWGDAQYGFVQNGLNINRVKGITVRGFPPVAEGLKAFKLGRAVAERNTGKDALAPDLSILRAIEETANALCRFKPKNRQEFSTIFEKHVSRRLKSPWGVSIYDLKNGMIQFSETASIK